MVRAYVCMKISEYPTGLEPLIDKINDSPHTWGPNTQLAFLTSIVKMSKQMQMEEEMFW